MAQEVPTSVNNSLPAFSRLAFQNTPRAATYGNINYEDFGYADGNFSSPMARNRPSAAVTLSASKYFSHIFAKVMNVYPRRPKKPKVRNDLPELNK